MKLLLFLLLLGSAFFPLKAEAKESASKYFSVHMNIENHKHIGPADSFLETFTLENQTSSPVKVRISEVSNTDNSILYSVLQAKWDLPGMSDTYISFDELTTDWFMLEPGETQKMHLNIYFPHHLGNEYQTATLKAKFLFECRLSENEKVTIDSQNSENHFTISSVPFTGDNLWAQIFHILGNCVTALLVVIAIYCSCGMLYQKYSGNLFFPFGYRPVVILSGSMENELMTGSTVIVKKTTDVEENDIIFFITKEGTPVIHRYVATTDNGELITKGDANPKEDLEPVSLEQVQGKVVHILKK